MYIWYSFDTKMCRQFITNDYHWEPLIERWKFKFQNDFVLKKHFGELLAVFGLLKHGYFLLSGFILSRNIVKLLADEVRGRRDCIDSYTVDAKYELAKIISIISSVKLTHEPQLCPTAQHPGTGGHRYMLSSYLRILVYAI